MRKIDLLVIIMIIGFSCLSCGRCITGNCKNGEGTYKHFNGTIYQGQFKEGKMYGHGTETDTDYSNTDVYWQNGNRIVEGWIDENTYRIVEKGMPDKKIKDETDKRKNAKKTALLNAQSHVLEIFKKSKTTADGIPPDFGMPENQIVYDVYTSVRKGSIKSEIYNIDDSCEIIYEVQLKDLKSKVILVGID